MRWRTGFFNPHPEAILWRPAQDHYHALLRPLFPGAYLLGGGFTTGAAAQEEIDAGRADAIVFGAAFLANLDLVDRLAHDRPLNAADRTTFYRGGATGYIDYPVLEGRRAAVASLRCTGALVAHGTGSAALTGTSLNAASEGIERSR